MQEMKWQPIENHPRDARYCVVRLHKLSQKQKRQFGNEQLVKWDGKFWRNKNREFIDENLIFGWIPLPEEAACQKK